MPKKMTVDDLLKKVDEAIAAKKRRSPFDDWLAAHPKEAEIFWATAMAVRQSGREFAAFVEVFQQLYGGPPGSVSRFREKIYEREEQDTTGQ